MSDGSRYPDKAEDGKEVAEAADALVDAGEGASAGDAAGLQSVFIINTIRDLAERKDALGAQATGQSPGEDPMTKKVLVVRRWLTVALLVVAVALVGGACGSKGSSTQTSGAASPPATATGASGSSTTGTTHLAKTKFVLHAGLAFGAFHRWIYKPLKAGELSHPLSHKVTTVKAGLAAVFTYHQLKLALADAQADPHLSHLVAPITALQSKMHSLGSSLKSGHADPAQIDQANSSIGSIHNGASAAGQPITEQAPASP